MLNIAVLISGSGTNLQALIDAQNDNRLSAGYIRLVVSDRPGAYGLERAAKNHIPAVTVNRKDFPSRTSFDKAIGKLLKDNNIHLVVLAGFLSILGEELVKEYDHRIINIHPALIPSFCGEGYYGLKVHRAALEKGVKVTGATVHYVSEIPDGGEIIMQKPVFVKADDTAESLQKRVMEEAEWIMLPMAVEQVCKELSNKEKGGPKNESI